jgi:hypothetical protein
LDGEPYIRNNKISEIPQKIGKLLPNHIVSHPRRQVVLPGEPQISKSQMSYYWIVPQSNFLVNK